MTKDEILTSYEVRYLTGTTSSPEGTLEVFVDWLERRAPSLSDDDRALLMAAGSVLYEKVAEARSHARRSTGSRGFGWKTAPFNARVKHRLLGALGSPATRLDSI